MLDFLNIACEFNISSSLKGISFSLQRGENAVIFGTENSGIDGICSLIAGVHPYSGNLAFMGSQISRMDEREKNILRKNVAFMQKNFGLISNMSVEENIALPLRYHSNLSSSQIQERVDTLIDELHLEYSRDMRPMNLKPSENLKTAYARSISLDPDLLLMEHPLEGQCLLNTITFLKHLKKRCLDKSKSVIIVTYEPMHFSDLANRYIMLDYGKIVFDGGKEMMENPTDDFVRQFLDLSGAGPMEIW
jgi:phospholipid/cholesterol/gamma-HCH transport system ATP-binding protein